MSDFFDVVHGRRSIRRYLDKEIPEEVLHKVLEAVRWAPSWANTQCWELVVVKAPKVKEALQATLSERNPSYRAVVNAPVLVALCGKLKSSGYYKGDVTTKFDDWLLFDLGIACQTLCLAAHAQGLGTVVVGLFDHDRAGEIVKLPDGYELAALIPMGYPDQQPSPPKRREAAEFCHNDIFGG